MYGTAEQIRVKITQTVQTRLLSKVVYGLGSGKIIGSVQAKIRIRVNTQFKQTTAP
jgi:hypothetical protein